MARVDELRLMTRVARLYHDDGVRQPEIARRLRLSQPKVSRLLKQAHEAGIVRISVRAPSGTNPELERAIEARYGLHDVEVVEVSRDDDEAAVRELGDAAAYHLEKTVRCGDVIGVSSWSATLLAMVDAMHPVHGVRDTQVVQILGGGGDPAAEGHATHLVRRMADLLHGEGTFLPAPSSVGSEASRDVLLEDPFVRRAMALFDDLDVALVGIGGQEPSGLLASSGNVFSEAELRTVREAGGVGDIGLRYLRGDGAPVRLAPRRARHRHRAGAAASGCPAPSAWPAGPARRVAIRAALLGGWINCLITDRFTGERLLEAARRPSSRPWSLARPASARTHRPNPQERSWHEAKTDSRPRRRHRRGRRVRGPGRAVRLHGRVHRGGGRLNVQFDPVTYVDDVWDDVQTVITDDAVPLADVLNRITPDAEGKASTESLTPIAEELGLITTGDAHVYRVKATGTVTDVDTETSKGSLGLTVDGYEGPIKVRVYVGTRIPSDESSIRDATGFIEFGDFQEQTEYGKVAAEINKRVVENLEAVDVEALLGKPVTVTGAFTMRTFNQPSVDVSEISLVPVELAAQ